MNKLRLKDEVIVLAGKSKGKTGTISKINWKKSKVTVAGVNMMKKTMKPTQENPDGGIVDVEVPLHISNIAILSPKTKKATRVRIESKDGKNQRVCVSCKTVLK